MKANAYTAHGDVTLKVIRTKQIVSVGIGWKLRNTLRWSFITGWLFYWLAKAFTKLTGIPTITGVLKLCVHKLNDAWVDYGVVGYKVVTDTGVAFMVDAWQGILEPEIMRYHGIGTGVGAELPANVALGTELTTEYNPDNTRATGTLTEGASANIFRSVGINTVDADVGLREHGLLSQAAVGGGVLWDRTLFALVNVLSGEQLQSTYEATFNSGG